MNRIPRNIYKPVHSYYDTLLQFAAACDTGSLEAGHSGTPEIDAPHAANNVPGAPGGGRGVYVPVDWIHSGRAQTMLTADFGMDQTERDLLRDTFDINGRLIQGSDGVGGIIGRLTTCLLEQGDDVQMTEVQVRRVCYYLAHTHDVI